MIPRAQSMIEASTAKLRAMWAEDLCFIAFLIVCLLGLVIGGGK